MEMMYKVETYNMFGCLGVSAVIELRSGGVTINRTHFNQPTQFHTTDHKTDRTTVGGKDPHAGPPDKREMYEEHSGEPPTHKLKRPKHEGTTKRTGQRSRLI